MKQEQFDRVVAGLATVIILALIFLWLFLGSLSWNSLALMQTAQVSQPPEEEEFFIEPEVLEDKGEEDAPEIADQQEAPAEQGEPEKAETESDKTIVRGENPKPALYADKSIRYEKVVDVLDMAARNGLKMVLSTRASQTVDEVQKRAEAAAADGIAGPTVR